MRCHSRQYSAIPYFINGTYILEYNTVIFFKWYLTIFCLCSTTILFIQRSGNESERDTSLLGSTNKATGHPRWQIVNKRKNNGVTKPGR